MKYLSVLLVLFLAGCANGSPIDFLIPTRKPSVATQEYLGHLFPTNACNGMYHSLSDTKLEKVMVPLRDAELKGLKIVAQGELEFIDKVGTATSNGIWGLVVAGAGLLGWQFPSPREKAKVTEALHKQPPQ
jgi:hypothetical protein